MIWSILILPYIGIKPSFKRMQHAAQKISRGIDQNQNDGEINKMWDFGVPGGQNQNREPFPTKFYKRKYSLSVCDAVSNKLR